VERPCAMIQIYRALSVTTVSLAANAYCMMDGPSSLHINVTLMTDQSIQQDAICCQWFKQQLILSVSQRSRIKEDTVEPSVLA